eukprot:CAMPEP_0174268078 /NCGR_PEP_ID=MMETSP0439-20130205/36049_1 /TAXON_ID=0 /ORGANISM="Stereomyxa ramosa, Strain Chinc5" /LENGTH=864 /DNA_ID=CAMNT_0015356025 /DNA_START=72 /DNA_END=2666 /DNA_ORIENTATION=-
MSKRRIVLSDSDSDYDRPLPKDTSDVSDNEPIENGDGEEKEMEVDNEAKEPEKMEVEANGSTESEEKANGSTENEEVAVKKEKSEPKVIVQNYVPMPASRRAAKAASAKIKKQENSSSDEDFVARKTVKKEDTDSDDDFEVPKKKKKDSDDDDFVSKKPRPKPVKKRSRPSTSTTPRRVAKRRRKTEDSDSEEEVKKETKKRRRSSSSTRSKKAPVKKRQKRTSKTTTTKAKKGKEKAEEEEDVWAWWEEEPLPKGKKWRTLTHNGVLFPPPYEPHGVKMKYNGKKISLTPEQEELATYYSQYLETDHVKKPAFNKNFFSDWKQTFAGTPTKDIIKAFDKCDFRPINAYLQERKEQRKNRSKEEKQKEKEEREALVAKYGWALVDGHKQKIGNFRVEPPGLFLGRGKHPKTGHVKKRYMPEDITINIGKGEEPPPCPIPGHEWGSIVHDDTVSWLAFWKENINNSFKYVWLSPSSRIKGQADLEKFEKSRRLHHHIEGIRANYWKEMKSKEKVTRQRATALWVIDVLALRVGNEKGKDEADTVGCCSLRVEHIEILPDNKVKFDFLGKDSMPYVNTVELPPLVYRNFKLFVKNKSPHQKLFDHLTTTSLNSHLKSQMVGLTAKVFRTYNASITLEKELSKKLDPDLTLAEKILFYNRANREVAILCNHQRSLPKQFDTQMDKLDTLINDIAAEKKELRKRLKRVRAGKEITKKEWLAPSKKKIKKSDLAEGEELPKPKSLPTTEARIKAAISRVTLRLSNKKTERTQREENKTVALGTSKINYMDPRITAAWCKRADVPLEKIFSKTLRDKFPWAVHISEDWSYLDKPKKKPRRRSSSSKVDKAAKEEKEKTVKEEKEDSAMKE